MTDLRQAAQQALEALIDAANVLSAPMFTDAVAALRAALEQPEQQAEPVAREGFEKWAKSLQNFMDINRFEDGYSDCNTDYAWAGWQAALAQPRQQAEPVAKVVSTAPDRIWLDLGFDPQDEYEIIFHELHDVTWSQDNASGNGIEYVRADTTPPRRPWQGLTNEDWEQIHDKKDTALDTFQQGAVWAADQLKERNT